MSDIIEDYVNQRHKFQFHDGTYMRGLQNSLKVEIDPGYVMDNNTSPKSLAASSEAKEKDDSLSEDELLDISTPDGKQWAKSSRAIYDRFTAGRTSGGRNTRFVEKGPKTDQEYARWGVEFMGQFNYNMSKMAADYIKLRDMDEETAVHMVGLMGTYDRLPNFTWNGTKRMLSGLLTDPTTYAGLGTLGLGFVGRQGTKQMTKKSFQNVLMSKIKNPYVIAALEGGAYGALDNALRQGVEIESGLREGVDMGRVAGSAATGAVAGTALVKGIDLAPKIARKVGDRLSQSGEMPTVGANFGNIPSVPFANLRERYSRILREAADGKDPQRIQLTPGRIEKAKQIANREFDPSIFASKDDFENFKQEINLPTKQMVAAKEFASLALALNEKVKLRMPDGERGSIYVKVGNRGTVRFADHAQPTEYDDKGELVPVGGFSSKLNRRHGVAKVSVDPESNISIQDAFQMVFNSKSEK